MAKYLNEQHGEYQIVYNNLMFKSFKSSKSYKMNIFRNSPQKYVRSYFGTEEGMCSQYIHFVRFGLFKRLGYMVNVKR